MPTACDWISDLTGYTLYIRKGTIMRATIARWGNSTALRLPKAVVDELRLTPGQQVEIVVEGREARVKPVRKSARELLDELLAECDRIGWENQPGLEDWSSVEAPWPKE
jgi:antitoxin MazE